MPVEGTLTFEANEDRKEIGVEIVDNDIFEEDETFLIHLFHLRAAPIDNSAVSLPCQLRAPFVATVMIIDNDHGGAFSFESEKFDVSEAAGEIRLKVRIAKKY